MEEINAEEINADEIEVGEWIRTKEDGYIGKKVKDGLRKGTIEIEDKVCSWIINTYNIAKHSKNIIDLIEVGDYVNGKEIKKVNEWKSSKEGYFKYLVTELHEIIRGDEIKSIVTKEQFSSVEYRLEV